MKTTLGTAPWAADDAAKAAGANRPTTRSAAMKAAPNRRTVKSPSTWVQNGTPGRFGAPYPARPICALSGALAVPPRTDSAYHRDMPNRLAGETSPYLLQHAGNP